MADGTVIEARYVEHFKGASSDSKTAHDTHIVPRFEAAGSLHHPNGCQGRPGVAIVWIRDGRTWCRADYRLRYGHEPSDADKRPPRKRYTPDRRAEPTKVSGPPGGKFLSL